jgi:hypothetical protein
VSLSSPYPIFLGYILLYMHKDLFIENTSLYRTFLYFLFLYLIIWQLKKQWKNARIILIVLTKIEKAAKNLFLTA